MFAELRPDDIPIIPSLKDLKNKAKKQNIGVGGIKEKNKSKKTKNKKSHSPPKKSRKLKKSCIENW